MASWPIDIELPLPGESLELDIQHRKICLRRSSDNQLELTGEAYKQGVVIGGSPDMTTARFLPSLGTMPLLVFPKSRLLCPGHQSFEVAFSVPVYIVMGLGSETRGFTRVIDFPPMRVPRALYGPVDSGIICRSVQTEIYHSLAVARRQTSVSEETSSETGESNPFLSAPPPAVLAIKLENTTSEPLDIIKIMAPLAHLNLYEEDGDLLTNHLRMKLLGELEAELTSTGSASPEAIPLKDLNGNPVVQDQRPTLFAHNYKQKTGLEFGF